jgi:hypothetical protein
MIGEQFHALAIAVIRTIVPAIVGWLVVAFGIDPESSEAFLTMLITAAYYTGVRLLAEFIPQAGWLLLVNKAPRYDKG